jgi:ATPase subunit of ABC transporter with duplicated ATPase domains
MGHIDIQHLTFTLPDGRVLLDDISFRVGEGAKVALVGANGAGKTTLMRLIAGDIAADGGSVVTTGGLGVMRQFIGQGRGSSARTTSGDGTVRDLLLGVSSVALQEAAAEVDTCEELLMSQEDADTQMRYAQALSDFADAGGYDAEVAWDVCCTAALGAGYDTVKWRPLQTLSGGEQKRLVLEALLRGPDDVLLLDEPDNYLDVPSKRWLEERITASPKTILLISHDRELLRACADTIVTVELGAAGNTVWVHGGGFATYADARADRMSRLEELKRRWDEEHRKLKDLVQMYKTKAAYNDGLASRYQAAQTRLRMFEAVGPPQAIPLRQQMRMRLEGGRTAKRAVVCTDLQLTDLTDSFNLEVWFGERLGVLGRNGAGKSHLLRLLAAGGTDPDIEHMPVSDVEIPPVRHRGIARLGSRVRPGWFAQTHVRPDLEGRTLLEILHRGDGHRSGMGREQAARALDRYGLAAAGEQDFTSLSGGQQARFQILLLELSGATLLLLDEPTDNLDLESAEALESALSAFEGTVVAVTHDRWFTRGLDRFIIVGEDGRVRESDEPVWD